MVVKTRFMMLQFWNFNCSNLGNLGHELKRNQVYKSTDIIFFSTSILKRGFNTFKNVFFNRLPDFMESLQSLQIIFFWKSSPGHFQSNVWELGAPVFDGVVDGGSVWHQRLVDRLEAARHHRHRAEVRDVHEGVRLPGIRAWKFRGEIRSFIY